MPFAVLEARAEQVATKFAMLASAPRLLILCHLGKVDGEAAEGAAGEACVSELQRAVGLSQSALSQHLAKLRKAGMVATRRSGQTIHYRLADEQTRVLMRSLYETFCAGGET